VFVILRKKFSQPTVEKLLPSVVSNGCGKGVGRTGGEVGMGGRFRNVGVAVDTEELPEVVSEDEGKAIPVVVDDASVCGCGFRLNSFRSTGGDSKLVGDGGSNNRSTATSNAIYRVDAVMSIRTSGTMRTAHLILRPVIRFSSSSVEDGRDFFPISTWCFSKGSISSSGGGFGDGGGVNMR